MSASLLRIARPLRQNVVFVKLATPATIRYNSQASKNTPDSTPAPNQSSLKSTGSETPVDLATTDRTPIATFPKDHPEGGPLAAATVSGAPVELQTRTVRIYKPSKPATQSSAWNSKRWKLDWDVMVKGGNWENPLMGWTSSADHMQGTSLYFESKEDAISFAEKQGYEYYVQEPNQRQFKPKAYAANFTHSPGKLKVIRTK